MPEGFRFDSIGLTKKEASDAIGAAYKDDFTVVLPMLDRKQKKKKAGSKVSAADLAESVIAFLGGRKFAKVSTMQEAQAVLAKAETLHAFVKRS